MPRVDAYKEKYLVKDFEKAVKKKMAMEFTQAELGEKFGGISQSGMGYKIRNGKFDLVEMVRLFNVLEFSNEEVLKVLGR